MPNTISITESQPEKARLVALQHEMKALKQRIEELAQTLVAKLIDKPSPKALKQCVAEVSQKLAELNEPSSRPKADTRTQRKVALPRPSPLDSVRAVVKATADLRVANGNLSATAVASAFGVSVSQLAGWLGRTRQALNKTPDADSLQAELAFFERVARLRAVLPKDGFVKWLRMPNAQLNGQQPLDFLARGDRQVVADLVDDMLTGAPV